MSLRTQLGLTDGSPSPVQRAVQAWPVWVARHSVLARVDGPEQLAQWLRGAAPVEANEVLLALGELGAVDGADDTAAASVLAELLVPGATVIARDLYTMCPRMDELVAGQLWISVRTLSWANRIQVASTVLMNVRRDVLRHLGWATPWADRVSLLDPTQDQDASWLAIECHRSEVEQRGAQEALYDLLEEAVEDQVLPSREVRLLLGLAEASDAVVTRRANAGLTSKPAVRAVAADQHTSSASVERRARRALAQLRGTYARRSA